MSTKPAARTTARDRLDHLAGEDLIAVGHVAEPGRLDDGRPEAVAALEADVAHREADPDRQRGLASLLVEAVNGLLRRPGRRDAVEPPRRTSP